MTKKGTGPTKAKALKAHVEMQRPDDGGEDFVYFHVQSQDGKALTAQQILEAVAEALLINWDNSPLEVFDDQDYDS